MASFIVHLQIDSIDENIIRFSLGTEYGIKLLNIEKNYLGYWIDLSERSRNDTLDG